MNQIGRYQIVGKLGEGGMGTVYRAYDPRFGREVALKVLPGQFIHNLELRERFEREAKIVASLEHSAIVPVHDFGEYNGQPFLVMRLMGGGSLSERLKNGALPRTEVARIISHLAPALDQAHAEGIIHRDLKPSNILFDQHNLPYITDFGIAKQTQAASNLTVTGTVMGMPEYMSPEQARGESNLSGHSDIYALGTILFQMVTGDVPYKANTPMGTALRHVTDPVPRINPASSAAVCQPIIDRAMAKLPQARYHTAATLSADLTALVHPQQRHPSPTLSTAPTQIVSPTPPSSNPPLFSSPPPAQPQPEAVQSRFLSSPLMKWASIAGIVGIVALVGCIALAIFAWSSMRAEEMAALTATAVEQAAIFATQTQEAIQTEEAIQTQEAVPSATPRPTPRPTPNRPATATAEALLQARTETEALLQDAELVHNSVEGTLEHDESRIAMERADVDLSNFLVSARFYNPYDSTEHPWDYGFMFRDVNSEQRYALIVDSKEKWTLFLTDSEGNHRLVGGSLENWSLSADQSNLLALLVSDTTGYFYVNQEYVATLDLSGLTTSGDIRIGTGFYVDNKMEDEATKFEEFRVWQLGGADSEETSSE